MINIEYKPYTIDTGYLFPPSLADFLGSNDEVHVFKEITGHLDISYLDSDFNGIGQHPYHPLMFELTNNASDRGHLPRILKEVKEIRKELGKDKDKIVITADNGYFSINNIEHEGEGIELLIASGREGKEKKDRQTPLVNRKQIMKAEMRARLKKPENQAIYRRRKWVVEQVIGQIKEGMGFRGVTMRGELFALAQWLFACAVHNLMKMVKFIAELRKLRTIEIVTEAA